MEQYFELKLQFIDLNLSHEVGEIDNINRDFFCILLYLYPGFYSYAEWATGKILDLLTETLLI